jgi:hypothetical protein
MATVHRDEVNFVGGVQYNGLAAQTSKVSLFDDFLGDVIEDGWSAAKGSDAEAVIAAIVAGTTSGAVRLTCGDTVTVAESASSLTHGLNWKAANGGLVFEAKITPVSSVANVAYFVGFTDVLATTTLEEPITLSGTTYTTTATDAVGFVFDTAATTDVWYGMGVANDVDGTAVACSAPTAGTAQTLRIELSVAGVASFYIDGVYQGAVAAAVTPSVSLTPVVEIMARTTAVKSIDVDYISVSMTR